MSPANPCEHLICIALLNDRLQNGVKRLVVIDRTFDITVSQKGNICP